MKKRIISLVLVAILLLSFTGCSKGGNKDSEVVANNGGKPVEIAYWHSGMGIEFLEAMIEAFNAKQSDWFVYYKASADEGSIKSALGQEDLDTVDLYMTTKNMNPKWLTPIDDVLDSVADGDSKKIKDKFNPAYLEYERATDDHYYGLTWGGGTVSIVYNRDMFKKAGIEQTPRTTDELVAVCDVLLEEDITPFIHFRSDNSIGYWTYMQELWFAQYNGWDYFLNSFYGCTDANGNSPSLEVFTAEDGRYEVLKAMEQFITPEYVLSGSNSQDHITAQTKFLNQDIGMMVSGSWMVNEMEKGEKTDKFGVMKSPVISSITDRLSTVKSDMELRNLISVIDAVTDGEKEISEYQSEDGYLVNGKQIPAQDWEIVAEARNSIAMNYEKQVCSIPKYSDAIDGAKEFLKFFYSDEGYKIYTDKLHVTLPFNLCEGEVDTKGWNTFEKDMYDITAKAVRPIGSGIMSRHSIFTNGGADPYASYPFGEYFCSSNADDRVTAEEAWAEIQRLIKRHYDSWSQNIK